METFDIQWQQLLWNCYRHGKMIKKDDTEVKEIMGNYIFLERPQDLLISFKRKDINTSHDFVEGVKKRFYDIPAYPIKGEALFDYINSWNDNNQIYLQDKQRKELNLDGKGFVYTYPERLLNIYNVVESQELKFINQFNTIYKRLSENKGSNRAVATLYHPGIDKNRKDIPCLNWLQATIRDSRLELHCMFRSNDLYGAWPSNMYLLTYLGLCLSERFIDEKIIFNGIHYHSSSLHIYKTDLPAVKEILGE